MSKTYQTGLIIEADNFRDKGSDRIAFVAHRLTGTELPGGVVFRHVLSIGDNAVTVPHFGYNYRCGKGGACPIHGTEPAGMSYGVRREFGYVAIVEAPTIEALTDLMGRIFKVNDVQIDIGPVVTGQMQPANGPWEAVEIKPEGTNNAS